MLQACYTETLACDSPRRYISVIPLKRANMFDDLDEAVAVEGMVSDEAAMTLTAEFEAAQKQIDSELLELEVKAMLEMI